MLEIGENARRILKNVTNAKEDKFLIIHADDLGMSNSINGAIFEAMRKGTVTSAAVMVVCPWFPEVSKYYREHTALDIGIHLTLTSEWSSYRWRPLSSRSVVPSLVDDEGFLPSGVESFRKNAKPSHVRIELRAQIQEAILAGFTPSHLDSHMCALSSRWDLYDVLAEVAVEFDLPFLGDRCLANRRRSTRPPSEVVFDSLLISGEPPLRSGKLEDVLGCLNGFGSGIFQLTVHPAVNNDESVAFMPTAGRYGAEWRERDATFLLSEELIEGIDAAAIKLISWKQLRDVLTTNVTRS